MLCNFIKQYNFTKKWMKPIITDSGFYLLVNSKTCKGKISSEHGNVAYHHRSKGERKPYIYLNLQAIEAHSKDDEDFVKLLCFTINHEFWHWLHDRLADEATSKEERYFYRLASIIIDIPICRFEKLISEYF